MAQTDSFVNKLWDTKVTSLEFNQFTKLGFDIYIYVNSDYFSYESFLNSSEATAKVDEDVEYLTSSVLQSFQNYVSVYDKYAIRVKMVSEVIPSVNNQAIGFCLAHDDFGTSCGTGNTGDATYLSDDSEYRTYWFDDSSSVVSQIKDDNPLDLWDAANDDNKIDDFYYGLTQYRLQMASSTTLVGDKFQYKEVSNESQWSNVKDYRWKAGDTVSLYRMTQGTNGAITWEWDENRELNNAVMTTLGAAVAAFFVAFAF